MKDEIYRIHNNRCANCGSDKELVFHHIVPLSQGGKHTVTNISLLCAACHQTVHRYGKFHDMQKARKSYGGRQHKLSKLPSEYVEAVFLAYLECRIGAKEYKDLLMIGREPSDTDEFKEYKQKLGVIEQRNNVDLRAKRSRFGLCEGDIVGHATYTTGTFYYTWSERRKKPEPIVPDAKHDAFLPLAPTIKQQIKDGVTLSEIIENTLTKKLVWQK